MRINLAYISIYICLFGFDESCILYWWCQVMPCHWVQRWQNRKGEKKTWYSISTGCEWISIYWASNAFMDIGHECCEEFSRFPLHFVLADEVMQWNIVGIHIANNECSLRRTLAGARKSMLTPATCSCWAKLNTECDENARKVNCIHSLIQIPYALCNGIWKTDI